MTAPTSADLLTAADATARLERAQAWLSGNNMPEDPTRWALRLSWLIGSCDQGYEDVREEVTRIVAQALPEAIALALAAIERKRDDAVGVLTPPAPEPIESPLQEHRFQGGPYVSAECTFAPDSWGPCKGCTCWKATRASVS